MSLFEQLIHTGLDYVTATTNTKNGIERFRHLGCSWLSEEARAGNDTREWMGHGFTGLSCGCIQFGTNGTEALLRVSGFEADNKARALSDAATNISRCDFQSTVRTQRVELSLAERFEKRAERFKGKHGSKFEIELRRNDHRGKTLYLGRRVSDRFIRIYDKARESQHPYYEKCWRAEVQFGGSLANRRFHQWNLARSDNLLVHDIVVWELKNRGVPWLSLPKRTYHGADRNPIKVLSDDEHRLKWLASQVSPTIAKLIERGKLEETLEALGLACRVKG